MDFLDFESFGFTARLNLNPRPESTVEGKAQGVAMDWNSLEQRIADDATGWIILSNRNPSYAGVATDRAIRADPSLMDPTHM